jgi:hypothetical protein
MIDRICAIFEADGAADAVAAGAAVVATGV